MTTKTLKTPEPFPRCLRLSPKEAGPDLAAKFATWVGLGELPAGAILARFVGSACDTLGSFIDEATGARMGAEIDDMDTLCHLTVATKPARRFLILLPQPAAGA